MKKFAVIGNPIAHSQSPHIQQAFAQQAGVSIQYDKILAPLDSFEQTVHEFFKQGGVGLNITVPFKEQAFAMCQQLSPLAKAAQAVNTLYMQNNQLYGDNTDGVGLVTALNLLANVQNTTGVIIGAGGATRGVILPLFDAGVKKTIVVNRTLQRAQQLQQDLQPFISEASLQVMTLEDFAQVDMSVDWLVNATSASLSGEGVQIPAQLGFNVAYEMAYGKPSNFLQQAKQRGAKVADGYSMLVGQAAQSFKIWHGVSVDIAPLLASHQHSKC